MVIGDVEMLIGQEVGEGLMPDGKPGPGLVVFPGMQISIGK